MRWREAMSRSLYGPDGFFTRRGPGPAGHFRTSATASPLLAEALATLLDALDAALGHPDPFDLVDIGAGRGELLTALGAAVAAPLRDRLRRTAVEVAPRPADLPDGIAWTDRTPTGTTGLLLATEWLDNVPLDLATGSPPRYLDTDGQPGALVDPGDAGWLRAWWPQDGVDGAVAEIGRPRDEAWAAAVGSVRRGLALAVDYGHLRTGRPRYGTLTGYRDGRQVAPVPDGSCDLTAHVAIDSVAAAGAAVAGTTPVLLTQRRALRALGVDGSRPPLAQAGPDPSGYLRGLARAGAAAELTDPAGLGGHWWLAQPVGGFVILPVLSSA